MKAMVYHKYGSPDDLSLGEIEKPEPEDDEVLIAVRAASVNWLDWHFLTGSPFMVRLMAGLFRPRNNVLGIDLAGRVEAVGPNVSEFSPGDEVFGAARQGCFAEYVCVPQAGVVAKPSGLTFEEAAAVPAAAVTALHALRDYGRVQPGQHVLINGGSGGVGSFAVQIAKAMGARVTGVCSTANLDLLRSLGADDVVDYTREDFCQNGHRYDVIVDVAGTRSFSQCKSALRPQGIYVTTNFSPLLALGGAWSSMTSDKTSAPLPPKAPDKDDLVQVKVLLESGQMKPVIDSRYPLNELPEALRHLERGHVRGKVVITV